MTPPLNCSFLVMTKLLCAVCKATTAQFTYSRKTIYFSHYSKSDVKSSFLCCICNINTLFSVAIAIILLSCSCLSYSNVHWKYVHILWKLLLFCCVEHSSGNQLRIESRVWLRKKKCQRSFIDAKLIQVQYTMNEDAFSPLFFSKWPYSICGCSQIYYLTHNRHCYHCYCGTHWWTEIWKW